MHLLGLTLFEVDGLLLLIQFLFLLLIFVLLALQVSLTLVQLLLTLAQTIFGLLLLFLLLLHHFLVLELQCDEFLFGLNSLVFLDYLSFFLRQFGHFDVDWDVAISYQFLKVLNVTLSTSMKYYPGTLIADKNGVEKERVQFKSVLGIGIGYSF